MLANPDLRTGSEVLNPDFINNKDPDQIWISDFKSRFNPDMKFGLKPDSKKKSIKLVELNSIPFFSH